MNSKQSVPSPAPQQRLHSASIPTAINSPATSHRSARKHCRAQPSPSPQATHRNRADASSTPPSKFSAIKRGLIPDTTLRKYVYSALIEYIARAIGRGRKSPIIQDEQRNFRINEP